MGLSEAIVAVISTGIYWREERGKGRERRGGYGREGEGMGGEGRRDR